MDSKMKAHSSNLCDNSKSLSVLLSPPPKTPEMSSPRCSPPYVSNIMPVNDTYNERTIDEELISESQTILRHCNESSSFDSSLSESTSPITNSNEFNNISTASLKSKLTDLKMERNSLSPLEHKSDNEDISIQTLEVKNLESQSKENEISYVNFENSEFFTSSPLSIKTEDLTDTEENIVKDQQFPTLNSETERKNEDALAVISLLETMNNNKASSKHHGSCYMSSSEEDDDLNENNLLVDDQELQAAVQEIKFATQDVLVVNEVTVNTSNQVSEEISADTEMVSFNDDDDNIEHELVVDETVINKSPDVISINDDDTQMDDPKELSILSTSVEFLGRSAKEPITVSIPVETIEVNSIVDEKELSEQCTMASDTSIDNELKIVSPLPTESEKTDDSIIIIEDVDEPIKICTTPVDIVLPISETDDDKNETEKTVETEVKLDDNEIDKTETNIETNECPTKELNDDEKLIEDDSKVKRTLVDSEVENENQPKPKRGRKAKNRKNSDSSIHSPRNEPASNFNEFMTTLSINTNLPSGNVILSPTSQSPGSSILNDVSPGSQNKRNKQQQQQQAQQHPYNVRRSVRTSAATSAYVNSNLLEEMYDDVDLSLDEPPSREEHDEDSKNGAKKASKRGRKKKNSNNNIVPAINNPGLTEIIVTKIDESLKKPFLAAIANSNRPKSSTSPYDVFEFTDEEDIQLDQIKPPHFMSSISEDKHHFEKRHPIEAINTDPLGNELLF